MAATAEQSRRRAGGPRLSAYVAILLAMATCTAVDRCRTVSSDGAGQLEVDTRIANAWRVLRVVDCARCHGKDYAGLAAPSIVDYAALQSYEMFVRMILDGDPMVSLRCSERHRAAADGVRQKRGEPTDAHIAAPRAR